MEKSVEEDKLVVVDPKDANPPHSERRTLGRRLIQSTLFRHRSQDNEDNGKDEEDVDEYCGSQSRSKIKKRKRKGKPKPTTPIKASVIGEGVGRKTESRNSPLTDGKRSRRQLKEKRQGDASPYKDVSPSSFKGSHCRQIMTNYKYDAVKDIDIQSEYAPEPVFDLRLEAKIAAEENARLFAGRQTHPFFSARKVGKKFQENLEATELESNWCSVLQEDKTITCRPIHVFEMLQDDLVILDWRNWIFCDKTLLNSSCALENAHLSVFEDSVEPLKFNDFLTISIPVGTFLHYEVSSEKSAEVKNVYLMSPTTSSVSFDGRGLHHQLEYLQVIHERNQAGLSVGYAGPVRKFDIESQDRMRSYYLDCGSQPDNRLWTNKYQPGKAFEVCGNGESVRLLNEWLCSWRERDLQTLKNSTGGSKCIVHNNYSWNNENDSDTESIDEGASFKNVILVTGPVGSGKTAAIYACAKEQGFQVIEVSASDWRNGAHVKQKFGEAMESHRFNQWSLENPVGSRRKLIQEFPSAQLGNSSAQEFDNEVVELISDEEKSENVKQESGNVVEKDNITSCSRGANKTLILFEDVDTIFDEDRGFIATIQQLAETAKRPMILTSNSKDPVLPDQLDRLEVCFTIPSPKEVLPHLSMVCSAENANLQPQLIERFIGCCQGDIRKTIMLLQFWCQGERNLKDRKQQCAYGLLQFDLDAGHWILPKVIPWGFPCQLSKLVEEEITKSLSVVKENSLLEVVEEEELSSKEMQAALEMGFNNETDSIEVRKEAMLSRNCFVHDSNGFSAQFDNVADFSNSSGSPVAFTRRTARRRSSTVLSSHSGDELCSDNTPVASDIHSGDPNNDVFPGVSGKSLALRVASQEYLDPSTDQLCHSERKISEQNLYKCSEAESGQHMCDTYKSVDISCVPESSLVPETEINNGVELLSKTVSCGRVAVTLEAVSLSSVKSIQSLSMIDFNNLNKVIPELDKNTDPRLRNTCNLDEESVHIDEEVGDSQSEHAEAVSRGYQVMDECSRADFNMASVSVENPSCLVLAGPLQETWRKLRSRRADLKLYVTSEQKDASRIVKLASGMTDLFSEADLMLGCCQPLINDSLEPTMVPSVEPDAFCWYHEQLEMTSTIAQHGLCFFAKESAAIGSNSGSKNRVDLAWEMLTSTTNTMALGKLVTQDLSTSQNSCAGKSVEIGPPRSGISFKRELEARLCNMIRPIVPSRSYLTMKGAAFHDYLSSLGQISKLEASRLSESCDKTEKKRRARTARHYLSTGPLTLSPEEVSLLAQHSCYGKVALEFREATYR